MRIDVADVLQVSHLVSDKAKKAIDVVAKFVEEECIPYVKAALPHGETANLYNSNMIH